jgi:hypothetical protein
MDTAPLKSFATWARPALIREVTARIAVVLAPASPQRVEQPKAVAALENAITAAGGGDKGRAAVADRVAYTWFNRIIALRFMDANGYTGIGVVSPQAGVEVGQPEILAEAKRANIDPDVVSPKIHDTVTGLLNGSRRSDDPQGEAYALLLAEYCRHWNRSMPFMFEREGDFTELLIPANLLADDSMINRAVKVLTEEVCQDVEVIGWLYQFYISERKDEVFAGFKKNLKAGAAEIPAATQLFTPHWIVRYLIENSLGRLWMLNNPSSRLVDQMDYYISPLDDGIDFLKIDRPEDIKLIDPASGSGHLLTYAFDLLYAIYEEQGYTPSDIPGLILTYNLYGTEIDPRAGALAAFALTMKARARQRTFFTKGIAPNIVVLEPVSFAQAELELLKTAGGDHEAEAKFWNLFADADVFGALIQPDAVLAEQLATHLANDVDVAGDLITQEVVERAHKVLNYAMTLAPTYSVATANPPYMGGANMSGPLVEFAKREFPTSKFDLMTMFMERCQALLERHGLMAVITLSSWMFTKDAKSLRVELLRTTTIRSLIHLGRGVFGSDYGSVAFVLENGHQRDSRGTYRKLYDRHVSVRGVERIRTLFLDSEYGRFIAPQSALESLPGMIFAYWIDSEIAAAFNRFPGVGDYFEAGNGITTSNNDRFLRYWWEVSMKDIGHVRDSEVVKRRWMPLNKGGSRRKWTGNREHVLDWNHDGKELFDLRPVSTMRNVSEFFRPTVSWSDVCNGPLVVREYGPEFAFESAANSAFVGDRERADELLAYANSSFAAEVSLLLNPGAHFKVGDFKAMPFLRRKDPGWREQIRELIAISDEDLSTYELDRSFARDQLLTDHTSVRRAIAAAYDYWTSLVDRAICLEEHNNRALAVPNGLPSRLTEAPARELITLRNNEYFEHRKVAASARNEEWLRSRVDDLVSYAVGCMFGRYSVDEPGLILADQGASLHDYLARVPKPTFAPDADNVIPIVDGDWFEDDIVARFRQFLRIAFGEQHFEENLRFVTESLGVKDLRNYFVKSFYKDHVQRYRKRPIYWLFSSPKGSFNALIYMHRYTPSTVSTVLNEYLREFKAKLGSALQQQERLAAGGGTPRQQAAAQKEADRIRKMLLELDEYEHDVLYPLASQQIEIDLDDGVKVNYPKFGAALQKISGLEASE